MCVLPAGHESSHQADPSWGDVAWSDHSFAGRPNVYATAEPAPDPSGADRLAEAVPLQIAEKMLRDLPSGNEINTKHLIPLLKLVFEELDSLRERLDDYQNSTIERGLYD